MSEALLIVDMQRDFMPGGPSPVPDAGDIVPLINELERCFEHVVATQRLGAVFAPGLTTQRIARTFDRGDEKLVGYLREKDVTDVYIVGMPLEFGVRLAALDARDWGFGTYVVHDACRGLGRRPGDVDAAILQMKHAGVLVIGSGTILGGAKRWQGFDSPTPPF